ncbi:M28 family peptidase [Undibacterium fentianense]|uniref:M28 family peptidase n=1 Tax=Undibacterium fentianense TaxID=2828728 RepID=A0A941E3V3_9BURK|nr:M28 family peptidase [Undibacterium fentianense]MBR7800531.1 M28 family peptidase [Undibacterium fentianense]
MRFSPYLSSRQAWSSLAILFAIILLIRFSLQHLQPVLHTEERSTQLGFSLKSAQSQLHQITRERHPIGSKAHARVRDYLIEEIRAIGLVPEIQRHFASFEKGTSNGQVENILVRLPGRLAGHQTDSSKLAPTKKSLLLVAHYDAVPMSFGASDDGVSVVSILQSLRALKSQGPLLNDVLVLLSDGEEAGLLGASGFAQAHPWMAEVGMVLNFDNRGNAGPVLMFEPSMGNAKLIAGLAQAVPTVVSNSVMYEVYKALPNDTDFTVFRQRGIPGLNFAMIQNLSSYHTRYDRSELISPASQQQQGEMMLQLLKYFGEQDLNQLSGTDSIYFNFPGLGLLHYPVSYALPLALFITLLWISCVWYWRQRESIRYTRVLASATAFLVLTGGIGWSVQLIWNQLIQALPSYLDMHDQDPGHFYLLGIMLASLLLFGVAKQFLSRWIRSSEWTLGTSFIWIILLALTSIRFPGASFLFAWPLLFVILSLLLSLYFSRRQSTDASQAESLASGWIIFAGSAFMLVLFAPLILLFNVALGFHLIAVPVILFIICLGLLSPLLDRLISAIKAKWIVLATMMASVSAFGLGAQATAAYHEAYPIPPQLIYVAYPQTKQYVWLSPNQVLDRTKLRMFKADSVRQTQPELFGKGIPRANWPYWVNPASDAGLVAPSIEIESDQTIEHEGTVERQVRLLLRQDSHASNTRIQIEGSPVLSAELQGQTLSRTSKDNWFSSVHAMPAEGVRLVFRLPAGLPAHTVKVRLISSFYALPTNDRSATIATQIPSANTVDFIALAINSLDLP